MKALLATAALALSTSSYAAVFTYTSGPVTFVDEDQVSTPITVTGLAGTVTNVSVRLNGFSHTYPSDMVIGLFNATAASGLVFMSGAGGGTDAVNVDLTFSDQAATQLPPILASGTYLPSNFDDYEFGGNNLTAFSGFNGLDPNAVWSLESFDVFADDTGGLSGGWSLILTTSDVGAVPEPATWAMMIGGFGLVGASLRRMRKARPALA